MVQLVLPAQAVAELEEEGCRWWFNADDEAEIQLHNAPYQQASPLESVLPSLFVPTTDRRRENLRQLADAMKALRWPQGAVCGTRGYYLVRSEA